MSVWRSPPRKKCSISASYGAKRGAQVLAGLPEQLVDLFLADAVEAPLRLAALWRFFTNRRSVLRVDEEVAAEEAEVYPPRRKRKRRRSAGVRGAR